MNADEIDRADPNDHAARTLVDDHPLSTAVVAVSTSWEQIMALTCTDRPDGLISHRTAHETGAESPVSLDPLARLAAAVRDAASVRRRRCPVHRAAPGMPCEAALGPWLDLCPTRIEDHDRRRRNAR